MLRRQRAGTSEINLTSLLDVLFCILFIVMLAGNRNEQDIKSDAQQQIEQLQSEIEHLDKQITTYQNQMDSYDIYHAEAIIITISNVREGRSHRLIISRGLESEEESSILLGTDRTQYIKQTLRSTITEYIDDAESRPIYIVFFCDRENIYTLEYTAVTTALTELQEEHKEIFFKTMEAEE